jgi:hypothetical protein
MIEPAEEDFLTGASSKGRMFPAIARIGEADNAYVNLELTKKDLARC